jgi:predicted ATPase
VQLRSERDPAEVIAEQIGDQSMLLVLDNCEHLIDTCARLADRLLRACPNLHVLATSRERLRIDGEVAWRVPPLSLPDTGGEHEPAALERFEAVRLFIRRAADASPGFTLTAENARAITAICRGLDGMPLALELAAARTAALSPEQIAERLGDAVELLRGGSRAGLTRQQTLRATLAWSHELLSGPEQILYRRLGVFAGSFGVEAVEGICADAQLSAGDTLDLLVRLVEKSLVQVESASGGHRYRLLETVRQDARERLVAAGERERVEAAHRSWYLALAEAADRDVHPEVAPDWPASRLEAEYDNLRAALASAIRNDPQAALALAGAMWWFWMARGFFVEGSRWLSEALLVAPEATARRARALLATAAIHVRRRRPLETVPLARESLEVARRVGDRHAEARALERMGVMGMGGFEWPVADDAFEAGLALAEELGDEVVAVAIKHDQGVLAGCRADYATARELLQDCLRILAGIPQERGPLFWAMHISPIIVPEGPEGALRSYFEDTFCLFRSVRSRAATAYVHVNMGEAWRGDADYSAARESLENGLELFREIGDVEGQGVALNALGNLARSSGDYDAGRDCFAEAYALREAAGDPREIATTLTGMGMLALWAGDDRGRDLLDQAMRIYERTEDGPGLQGIPLNLGGYELDYGDPAIARVLFEQSIASCREQSFDRNRGFAALQLSEAAMRTGDYDVARDAIDEAREALQRGGVGSALSYLPLLEQRLGALSASG